MSELRYRRFKIGVALVSLSVTFFYGVLIKSNLRSSIRPMPVAGSSSRIAGSSSPRIAGSSSGVVGSSSGYILATHYSDQLTGSSVNLLSLQCWASTLKANVRVVEPFIHYGSILGVDLDPSPTKGNNTNYDKVRMNGENTVKLGDIFDRKEWSNIAKNHHLVSSLVSWEDFLEHSPRNLILVDKACNNKMKCMQCKNGFSESIIFHDKAVNFAKFNGFEIVRKVCYDLRVYNISSFKELVYGEFNPDNTVVIFNHWGGIELGSYEYRIPIRDKCGRGHFFLSMKNSKRIINDSKHYIDKFFQKESYISVMLRVEHLSIKRGISRSNVTVQSEIMTKCIQSIMSEIKNKQKKMKTNPASIFISTDIGIYGSRCFRKYPSSTVDTGVLNKSLSLLYHELFGDSISMSEHMRRIEHIVSFKNPGYVAILQKEIAANGVCLLLGGGGSFQKTALQLYKRYNLGKPNCYSHVSGC